jgi:hypothetical protein
MAALRLPKNDLPRHMYEKVKIVNASHDVTFIDSYGKFDENSGGDIVLGPRKCVYRQKFEAYHWFGDWSKEGKEWEAEVTRIAKRKALVNEKEPQWIAIKEGKLYVEGCTEKKDYNGYTLEQYSDKHQQFSLDGNGPEDSRAFMDETKMGLVMDLPEDAVQYTESAEVTPFKK